MEQQSRNSHKDLILWQKALDLAVAVHELSAAFPKSEIFGLVSRIRRAAVSIPSNIAEGSARRTTREFIALLHIARGSMAEVETQLRLAQRIGYVSNERLAVLQVRLDDVGRIMNAVIAGLRRRLG